VNRPAYHFTPTENWLNDPNGLVYHVGEYHLFYQHHPHSLNWGPMHWGHAVSHDLLNWEHLPIALHPDEHGMIFSGSAVIDRQNTAGFGQNTMVAVFTHHRERTESQSIAYSLDNGRTWTKYAGNPVIPAPNPPDDFRDPKVFWHHDHWVMLLAAGRAVLIYTSPNLLDWKQTDRFTSSSDDGSIWETPDLFQLLVEGTNESLWVLTLGINAGTLSDQTGTRYIIGQFDGERFIPDPKPATPLWADYGPDFYASQTWNNEPHRRRICIAWMNNWRYAANIPASDWRGTMTIPRQLTLVQTDAGIRLAQNPIPEMNSLRGKSFHLEKKTIHAGENPLDDIRGPSLEIIAEIGITSETAPFGFHFRKGKDEQTTITCDPQKDEIQVDRFRSGQVGFDEKFAAARLIPFPLSPILKLHVFIDTHSLEIFINDGVFSYTANIFPNAQSDGLEFFVSNGDIHIINLDIYDLSREGRLV